MIKKMAPKTSQTMVFTETRRLTALIREHQLWGIKYEWGLCLPIFADIPSVNCSAGCLCGWIGVSSRLVSTIISPITSYHITSHHITYCCYSCITLWLIRYVKNSNPITHHITHHLSPHLSTIFVMR